MFEIMALAFNKKLKIKSSSPSSQPNQQDREQAWD